MSYYRINNIQEANFSRQQQQWKLKKLGGNGGYWGIERLHLPLLAF